MTEPQTGRLEYVVPPWITHERLDDEVMAIDLETGAYFALDDAAADAWSLVTAGIPIDGMAAAIAAHYDVEPEAVRTDLEHFVAELEQARLVVRMEASERDTASAPGVLAPFSESRVYVAPVVNKFDDLEQLLRLDPVHEVDDVGWPVPRRE